MDFGKPQMHKNFVSVDVTMDSADPLPGTDWLTLRFESSTSLVVCTGHLISGPGGFTQQDITRGIVVLDGIVTGLARFIVPEGTRQVGLALRGSVADLLLSRDHHAYPCPFQHSLTAMQQMAKAADEYMLVSPVIRDLARVVFLGNMYRQAEEERQAAASALQSKIDFRDQVQRDLRAAKKAVGREALAVMDRAGGSC